MQLRNKQDFWSGVMFILLGLGFAWKATSYSMGTAARMGPGYFPHWLGILMAILGAVVLLTSLRPKAEETTVAKLDFKILAIIIGAIVGFGLLLRRVSDGGLLARFCERSQIGVPNLASLSRSELRSTVHGLTR